MKSKVKIIQLNLSTTATFGAEESGHCKEVAIVDRFWTRVHVWILCLLGQKSGLCREVAVCRGSTLSPRTFKRHLLHGAKKVIFTACHSGKLKLPFTSPNIISTSPQHFLMSRIDFIVLLSVKFLNILHLPVGQVKNRIHWPDSKIH